MDTQTNTPVSFVEAFRQVVIAKIACLPTDASDDTTETVMREILDEINTNDLKHHIVVEIIYSKAMLDSAWSTTAIKLLAHLCDIDSPGIDSSNKDACTVRKPTYRYITRFLQDDFEKDMEGQVWNAPRIHLLAQLGSTDTLALRIGPVVNSKIIEKMVLSENLFVEANFDLLIHFVYTVRPNIDVEQEWSRRLDAVLQSLRDRVSGQSTIKRLTVLGLLHASENDWKI